jgi:hypothetical protein
MIISNIIVEREIKGGEREYFVIGNVIRKLY